MVHPKLVELIEGLLDKAGNNSFTLEFKRTDMKKGSVFSIDIKDNLSDIGYVLESNVNDALIEMMEQMDKFVNGE